MKTRLVLAVLASPLAAAFDLVASYSWVGTARLRQDRTGFHVIAAIALVVIVAGVLAAATARRRAASPGDRLLVTLAVALGAFFALLVVGFEVPVLVLSVED